MSEEYLEEWVSKAEEDHEAAVDLARRRRRPLPNSVCFHCQQCAEKYLKSYLIYRGTMFPKMHNLVALLEMCVSLDETFEQLRDPLVQLNSYATEVRYPGKYATIEEAREAIQAMKLVRRFVRTKLRKMRISQKTNAEK